MGRYRFGEHLDSSGWSDQVRVQDRASLSAVFGCSPDLHQVFGPQ